MVNKYFSLSLICQDFYLSFLLSASIETSLLMLSFKFSILIECLSLLRVTSLAETALALNLIPSNLTSFRLTLAGFESVIFSSLGAEPSRFDLSVLAEVNFMLGRGFPLASIAVGMRSRSNGVLLVTLPVITKSVWPRRSMSLSSMSS